jgi:hypothetical protein
MKPVYSIIIACTLMVFTSSCGPSAADRASAIADSTRKADSLKNASEFNTPEAIAGAIVEAISKNDYAAFSNLFITKGEMVALMKASTNPDDQEAITRADDIMKDIISGSKASFDRVRQGGGEDGIIWEQAKYKNSEYEMSKKDGIESMELKIVLDYKGAEYMINVQKVVKTAAGWKLVGQANYGNDMDPYFQRLADSMAAAESAAAAADSAAAAGF